MLSRIITLTAVAVLGVSSAAFARGGGGGGGGWSHGGMAMHGRGHFDNRFVKNLFLRNQALLGGWGWGWDWGWPYSDSGGSNTTVVFPQATPRVAHATGLE